MVQMQKFYINGEWADPLGHDSLDVVNPATGESIGKVALGNAADVDRAVAAARAAFPDYSRTSREERVALLEKILAVYKSRIAEMATLISDDMGAPMQLSSRAQAPSAIGHFKAAIKVLKDYPFSEDLGSTCLVKEPVGVCGLITPWNWPMNQISCKVAPALAAGCTVVLKPSEVAPLSALLFAEILDQAGVPKGVFNLVNGDGPTVGRAISSHPDIDFVSFTGSTRAGRDVARNAAESIKRVAQELGGKSANIVLDDADFEKAIAQGVMACMANSGQSCNAPTRMLVPATKLETAITIAKATAEKVRVGDPKAEGTVMGPMASEAQWRKVRGMIEKGVAEGAKLETGGTDLPDGLGKGFYVRPTIFSGVNNDMTIAREEIFGPVLVLIPYKDDDDAVRIANDTPYGLSGYVSSANVDRARSVASRLRTGNVHINDAPVDPRGSFGGYKESGNGREWGLHGFEEFLEVKSIFGYNPA